MLGNLILIEEKQIVSYLATVIQEPMEIHTFSAHCARLSMLIPLFPKLTIQLAWQLLPKTRIQFVAPMEILSLSRMESKSPKHARRFIPLLPIQIESK